MATGDLSSTIVDGFCVGLDRRAATVVTRSCDEARTLDDDSSGLVFHSRNGKSMTDVALSRLLTELEIAGVPHGHRSYYVRWRPVPSGYDRKMLTGNRYDSYR